MSRPLQIVVDVESNGLNPERHQVVEVAYWNLATDERDVFVPVHNRRMVMHDGEIEAFRVNGYLDRIVDRMLDKHESRRRVWALHGQLDGATLIGSNPAFDAAMLTRLFKTEELPPPWHHRLWDVSAYAAGVLGLDELPGLAKVCDLLDIEPGDHSAEADVQATGLCFRELQRRASR